MMYKPSFEFKVNPKSIYERFLLELSNADNFRNVFYFIKTQYHKKNLNRIKNKN